MYSLGPCTPCASTLPACVDLQGGHRILTQGWWSIEGIAWRPEGKEIWFAGTINSSGWADAIHAVTVSGKERTVLAMPWVRLMDISREGRVLLVRQNWRHQLVGKFPGDSTEHPYSWLDDTSATAISNDGHWLTFVESGEIDYIAHDRQAYYRKTDGSAVVSLGAGQAVISPDGKSSTRKRLTAALRSLWPKRDAKRFRRCLRTALGLRPTMHAVEFRCTAQGIPSRKA